MSVRWKDSYMGEKYGRLVHLGGPEFIPAALLCSPGVFRYALDPPEPGEPVTCFECLACTSFNSESVARR